MAAATNYEYACNVITMLQLLRQKPKPVRKSSSLAPEDSKLKTQQWRFANIQLRKGDTELLPFPPVQRKPKSLCLKVVMDGYGGANSGLSNRSFCSSSLEAGGIDVTADTPINNNSFNNNLSYGYTSSTTGSFLDAIEIWTVEAFSEVTKGKPEVATMSQMAGLCRVLCAHSTLNPLPPNMHRVGLLHIPGSSSGPAGPQSTMNSFCSDDYYVSNNNTGDASGNTRQWHVLSAAGKSCLSVTWQLNPSAAVSTPHRRMSLLRNPSPAPQTIPVDMNVNLNSKNMLVGSFGTVTGSFASGNGLSSKKFGETTTEGDAALPSITDRSAPGLHPPLPISPRPSTVGSNPNGATGTPNNLRPQAPHSAASTATPPPQSKESNIYTLIAACECVQSSSGGGAARDAVDEYKMTMKKVRHVAAKLKRKSHEKR